MHAVLIIIAPNAVLIGFCCLIAGWASLIGADQTELAELRQGVNLARHKSWIEALRFAWKWRCQYPTLSRLAAHWAERRHVRYLIAIGFLFLGLAAAVGYFLGAFNSP